MNSLADSSLSTDWNDIRNVVAELRNGRPVVLSDDRAGGGAGDLIICAAFADAAAINFMAREARGLIGLALPWDRCAELELDEIPPSGDAQLGGSMMVSIEAREGVSTGISAGDRARTIAVAVDPSSRPEDLVQPGHVFPLRARPGGVLERAGRIEAAVDLAYLAGRQGAAVICQLLRDDGRSAREEDLATFAADQRLGLVTVSAVAAYCRALQTELISSAAAPAGGGGRTQPPAGRRSAAETPSPRPATSRRPRSPAAKS